MYYTHREHLKLQRRKKLRARRGRRELQLFFIKQNAHKLKQKGNRHKKAPPAASGKIAVGIKMHACVEKLDTNIT